MNLQLNTEAMGRISHRPSFVATSMNRSTLSHVETSALIAFIEVAERGSFTAAAIALNLSQPTVSQQIQRLERLVGIKLLHRRSNKVCLSQAGEAFIIHCRTALHSLEMGMTSALESAQVLRGKVTIGLTCFNLQRCLSRVLHRYRQHHPDVSIDILEGSPHELVQSLQNQTLDMAIVSLPIPTQILSIRPLYEEPLVLVVSPQHPLAPVDEMTWADICDHPLLLPRQGSHFGLRSIVETLYRDRQAPVHAVEVNGYESLRQLLLHNYGIAFLPRSLVQKDVDGQRLVAKYPADISLSHTVAIATHAKQILNTAAQNLATTIPQLLTP